MQADHLEYVRGLRAVLPCNNRLGRKLLLLAMLGYVLDMNGDTENGLFSSRWSMVRKPIGKASESRIEK
jgi:hypothetical protein